jgi:spermidine synthase
VVELARQYFNFGRADDAQTTVTVQVADGREVLEQSPPSTYDLVMVDLSVAGFVDENACSDLRRVLRPGGVCVHNYNFASGQAIPDALPANFSQAHQLVIDASNTILVSTTTKIHDGDDFNKIVDQSVAFPYASPLPFDLRAVSSFSKAQQLKCN